MGSKWWGSMEEVQSVTRISLPLSTIQPIHTTKLLILTGCSICLSSNLLDFKVLQDPSFLNPYVTHNFDSFITFGQDLKYRNQSPYRPVIYSIKISKIIHIVPVLLEISNQYYSIYHVSSTTKSDTVYIVMSQYLKP